MNNYVVDEWIPIEHTHLKSIADTTVKDVMFKLFDEYCVEGVYTASLCFRFNNGDVSGFFHPPKEFETDIDTMFTFNKEKLNGK